MKKPTFWKSHYVVEGDADEIERHITVRTFLSEGHQFDLLCFVHNTDAPNVVISPGSGGHSYVFAEFGYQIHRRGYNVIIMPKHGGQTVAMLMQRHRQAFDYVIQNFNARIGVYGEGLGGYVAFYLALAQCPIKGLVCQNSPGILTDRDYIDAVLHDGGPWARAAKRRRLMLPVLPTIAHVVPRLKIPIRSYLDWEALIDQRSEARDVELRLVREGYLNDPDFDRWYPLSHVMSMVATPPPQSVSNLRIPTMFIVADHGPTPAYIRRLYHRLPTPKKRLHEVKGSVYWMLSHPRKAADVACAWFDQTVRECAPLRELTPKGNHRDLVKAAQGWCQRLRRHRQTGCRRRDPTERHVIDWRLGCSNGLARADGASEWLPAVRGDTRTRGCDA